MVKEWILSLEIGNKAMIFNIVLELLASAPWQVNCKHIDWKEINEIVPFFRWHKKSWTKKWVQQGCTIQVQHTYKHKISTAFLYTSHEHVETKTETPFTMHIKKNQRRPNKWRDKLCSWIRRLHTIKMSILSKLAHRFNAIPIKITVRTFLGTGMLILKQIYMERQSC